MSKVFGIDLGTTYSAIAHINDLEQAEVIENLEGDKTTPSVVYFEDENNFTVGKVAKNGQKIYPDDTVSLVKRMMGEQVTMNYQGKDYTPESISALILRELVEAAQEIVGSDSKKVVITVPAYFGLVEKDATRTAGEIAGLEVQGIIAEPIAAALSAGYKPGEDKTVFVYDLGGGTFDCTVLRMNDESVSVLAVDGDRELGGADWDTALFDLVLERFMEQAGLEDDPSLDDEFYQDLLSNVEDAKKALTKKTKTKVRCSYGAATEMVEVERADFERATRPLVERTLAVAKRTLAMAEENEPGLKVDSFLLVGGSSRMPMIAESLEKELGWKTQPTEFDLAVAKGAAIYGQGAASFAEEAGNAGAAAGSDSDAPKEGQKKFMLTGSSHGVVINNLLSKSVGVQLIDKETKQYYIQYILDRGTPLPAEGEFVAATAQDNTDELPVRIYEQAGEVPSPDMAANKEITPPGGATFTDLPNLPEGSPIAMRMKVDSEGLLSFEGFEPVTQQRLNLSVKISTMQDADIAAAKAHVASLTRND